MKTPVLYVIGNGFDLHHWKKMGAYPDTSFSCFGSFLKENRTEIFDLLVQVFNFQVDPLASSEPGGISCWGEFESTLGNFEAEQVWESVRDI